MTEDAAQEARDELTHGAERVRFESVHVNVALQRD